MCGIGGVLCFFPFVWTGFLLYLFPPSSCSLQLKVYGNRCYIFSFDKRGIIRLLHLRHVLAVLRRSS